MTEREHQMKIIHTLTHALRQMVVLLVPIAVSSLRANVHVISAPVTQYLYKTDTLKIST